MSGRAAGLRQAPRQLGQEQLFPGATTSEAIAGREWTYLGNETKQGKFGKVMGVRLHLLPDGPDATVALGEKATAFDQFVKEAPASNLVCRFTEVTTKKAHQTAYIVEVVREVA